MVRARGGIIRGGCEVVGLERKGRTVSGVKLKSGEMVPADIVVVSHSTAYKRGELTQSGSRWCLDPFSFRIAGYERQNSSCNGDWVGGSAQDV